MSQGSSKIIIIALGILIIFSGLLFFFMRSTVKKTSPDPVIKSVKPVGSVVDGVYGVEYNGFLIPEMVEIAAAEFTMGSEIGEGFPSEFPKHKVSLKKFFISRFEITNIQFYTFCKAKKRSFLADPRWVKSGYPQNYPDHPVVQISWQTATDYCAWLSELTGKKFRLPTEAEWEYAAKGSLPGTTLDTAQKAEIPTTRVGSHQPNHFGLYDMLGNAAEWCLDWYDGGYYKESSLENPSGPEKGTYKVIRGGGWANSANKCQPSRRSHAAPEGEGPAIGFRVVMEVD